MVEDIKAAFARRVEALDWMAPSTKEEALKKVRSIVVGVGYPDTWRDYFVARDRQRRLRQPEEREPCRISPPDREDRQADGPQRMVDAAAAGQRGQPAGAERAQLPGGDPPAALLRSQGRRGVQLWRDRLGDRARDQPQLRQQRRPVRFHRAACATGGRRPTSSASRRRATRSRRSTTSTKRFRACT